MRHISFHAGNNKRCLPKRRLEFILLTGNHIQNCHLQYHGKDSFCRALRNSAANCFAVSTGVSLPPIVLTQAVPTMTPSAMVPSSLACSGVPIPNPTHTGTDVCSRTR